MKFIANILAVVLIFTGITSVQAETNDENKEWTLEDCLEYGLTSHPKVKIAKSSLDGQKASLMSAKGAYDVSLSGGVSYSLSGRDRPTASHDKSMSESLSLSKKIFDPKTDLQKLAVKEGLSAAFSQYNSTIIELAARIKSAYFQAQQRRALLEVRLETLESYERHLKKVESFVEVGTRAPYDITKAQVDVANARVALISARSALKLALANMGQAMGIEGGVNIAAYEDKTLPDFENLDMPSLLDEAMNRPDVKAREANLKASGYSLDRANKGMNPSLSSSAGYSWRGENTPQNRSWNAGVSLSWPIFEGRINKALILSAKSNLDSAEAGLSDLRLSVHTELENAITDLTDSLERYEANKVLVKQAEESLELAEARYDTGIGSALEVSDARVEFTSAQGNYIVSYFESLIANTNLDKILGRFPEEYQNN